MPDETLTPERIAALRAAAEAATPGPWEVQDGCSWRRIGRRHPDGRDGDVLCPIVQRDGHPDLLATPTTLAYIAAASPDLILALLAERDRMNAALNTPELHDFSAGVVSEAQHQRERWGSTHDAGKTPEDWFWLIGYLAGKALHAAKAGDTDKALHHTISTAAALANWHAALAGQHTGMRPGIGEGSASYPPARAALGQDGGQ